MSEQLSTRLGGAIVQGDLDMVFRNPETLPTYPTTKTSLMVLTHMTEAILMIHIIPRRLVEESREIS
ncbi:hypothetical protein EON65_17825 [archaeon]|nr:MAG: hypothetical protein EON65_17825 [archaeon]